MGHQSGREHVCTAYPEVPHLADRRLRRFASAILLRPFKVDKAKQQQADGTPPPPPMSEYEQQVELKRRLRTMLENELLIPRELIFLTRCQRMMQANNQVCRQNRSLNSRSYQVCAQSLGSPSPRINITAHVGLAL